MSQTAQPSQQRPSPSRSSTVSHAPQQQDDVPGPSTLLIRRASESSQPLARVPSPRPSVPPSTKSTFTPKLLSRQSSIKEKGSALLRRASGKRREAETAQIAPQDEGTTSPMTESGSVEVIETQAARVQRDYESGRWMINQYKVLQEIGHGTHGRVRLGEDLSVEIPVSNDEEVGLGISSVANPYYAIKIVDRNPKKKKLTGLGRQRGMKTGKDGAKLLNESEIRKEIAIFKKVNHPNVVRMKEIIDDPESSKIYMILEWCENGEIKWKEDEARAALTIGETRKAFRDTLLGLEYLHHQGIIHRDIKPSNLLRAADGTVKISDFGCSHFSEALRAAAVHSECDSYVDDIELAKTAGSPAFFAPEMCYSGLETDMTPRSTSSPQSSPMHEIPAFTLRPPSVLETRASQSDPMVSPGSRNIPLKPTVSNDSALSRRPQSARSYSSATIQRRERLAITNAIDVWALGVTLYCLFFGRTPFDAPNEYLLMQVIPSQDYIVPPFMGKDHVPTGSGGIVASDEAKECLDLLSRLLEKDPQRRITLEQAKRHPFTLRGLVDPVAWLAKTDPHTQTFVTVSSDEVAAVVTKSVGFRDRFRKGIKSISHKLQILGGAGRNRSRSIGDTDTPQHTNTSSVVGSQISLLNTPRSTKPTPRIPSTGSDPLSPMMSPLPPPVGLTRRLSILGAKLTEHQQAASTHAGSSSSTYMSGHTSPDIEGVARAPVSRAARNFVVHRRTSTHLAPPNLPIGVALADEPPRSPRAVASSSSLDKVKSATAGDFSPSSIGLRRRGSSEVDVNRQRSHSNASSISSKLVRLLRSGSHRSRTKIHDKDHTTAAAHSDNEDAAGGSVGSSSPADVLGRMSLDEGLPRQSFEGIDWGSYSSRGALPQSPDRFPAWDQSRAAPVGRDSIPSEDLAVNEEEREPFDWTGAISDEDDYDESTRPSLTPSAPNLTPSWRRSREGLGLDQPVQAIPTLEPIPDGSPAASSNLPARPSPLVIPYEPIYRTSSRTSSRLSSSPFRPTFTNDRARSPLGFVEGGSPMRLNLSRQTSASVLADDDDDEGLAISIGSKRGRKGSMLGRTAILPLDEH